MSERTYSEDEMAALLERAAELQAHSARPAPAAGAHSITRNAMPRLIPFLLLTCIATAPLRAQEASFTIPDEIVIESGRLSVVFVDGVTEHDAVSWLREADYEPIVVQFADVVAQVQSSEPFSEARVRALRDRAEVASVESTTAPRWGSDGLGVPAFFVLVVRFHPPTGEEAVRRLIEETTGLSPFEVTKIPNDVEIRVPEGEETMVIETLQENPWVDYVTYVAVIEG
ncbi:MAG: hypothetical protein SH809_08870 [Rhodothermales bacterium]|nr:hypothetical protein [Rhodothermales bacterium]